VSIPRQTLCHASLSDSYDYFSLRRTDKQTEGHAIKKLLMAYMWPLGVKQHLLRFGWWVLQVFHPYNLHYPLGNTCFWSMSTFMTLPASSGFWLLKDPLQMRTHPCLQLWHMQKGKQHTYITSGRFHREQANCKLNIANNQEKYFTFLFNKYYKTEKEANYSK